MTKKIVKKVITNNEIILKQSEIVCINKEYGFEIYLHNNKIYSIPNQLGKNLNYKNPSKDIRKIIDRNCKTFKNKLFKCKAETNGGMQEVYCLTRDIIIEICKLSKQKISTKFQSAIYLYSKNLNKSISTEESIDKKEKRKTINKKQKELSNKIPNRDIVNETYILLKHGIYDGKDSMFISILNDNKLYNVYINILDNFETLYNIKYNKELIIKTNIKFKEIIRRKNCG